MSSLPKPIENVIEALSNLPGVGPRTAERYAYYLLRSDPVKASALADAMSSLHNGVSYCPVTFALIDSSQSVSPLYSDPKRDKRLVVIVADPFDIVAIESTNVFNGTYHVLGGLISPIDGIGPEQLHINELVNRLDKDKVKEVVLAISASVEGESTALYISQQIGSRKIKITKIARGLPVGVDLEYADQMTLTRAFEGRQSILWLSVRGYGSTDVTIDTKMTLPTYPEIDKIQELVAGAEHIVIIQADNPDVDSLGSALSLEHILGDIGKQVTLYCGVDIPTYMNYLPGWDRVVKDLPNQFDISIIVDTSSNGLLEQLDKNGFKGWLSAKPCIVIDHHTTEATISFASVICNPTAVATGEVIYELARQLNWSLNPEAKRLVASAILGDSLGLMTVDTSARSIQIISELVEGGVMLADLENARRETMRREPELIPYKGQLLQRVEFLDNGRIASLVIPWDEIEKYSPLYNPPMLVMDDMRLAKGADIAVCFKLYTDGKITAKIRCNYGFAIADKLAEYFGGGGHPYAAGFKIRDGRSFEDIKNELVGVASGLLDQIEKKYAETS